jgi:hypothetical protein
MVTPTENSLALQVGGWIMGPTSSTSVKTLLVEKPKMTNVIREDKVKL